MKKVWLHLSVILLSIALTSAVPLTPSPVVITMNQNDQVTIPITGSGYNDCTGENIEWYGNMHMVLQTVTNKNKIMMRVHQNYLNVTAVGASGKVYRGTYAGNASMEIANNGGGRATTISNLRLVSAGGENLYVRFTSHFVMNSNGTVTVSHDVDKAGCQ